MHNNPVGRSSNTGSSCPEFGEQRIPVAVLLSPHRKYGVAPGSAASLPVTNGDPTGEPAGCRWGEIAPALVCV